MTTVFIISAPSGRGKSTLVAPPAGQPVPGLHVLGLLHHPPAARARSGRRRATTSSPARSSKRMIARDEFLEWAEVFGNYYGTHRGILEQARAEGKDLVLDIDVQGARQLKE